MTELRVPMFIVEDSLLHGLSARITGVRIEDGCFYFAIEGAAVPPHPMVTVRTETSRNTTLHRYPAGS